MSRVVALLVAFAALLVPSQALASLTLTSPSPGTVMHLDQTLTISWTGSALADANDAHASYLRFVGTYETFTMSLTQAGIAAGSLAFVPDTAVAVFLAAHPEVLSVGPASAVALPPSTYTVELRILKGDGTTSETTSNVGLAIQNQCDPGTYSTDGWPPCTQATPGHYVYTGGATGQLPCAPGTFNGTYSSYTCFDVPPGTYAAAPGATVPTDCPVGAYQDAPGQTSCTPAPAGTFVAAEGALSATPCPAGTSSPAGAVAASACVALEQAVRADTPAPAPSPTVDTACTIARGQRVAAACVARQLGVSIARPKRTRLSLAPRRQAACAIKRRVIRGVAAGSCRVVLVVVTPGAKSTTYRATVTIGA